MLIDIKILIEPATPCATTPANIALSADDERPAARPAGRSKPARTSPSRVRYGPLNKKAEVESRRRFRHRKLLGACHISTPIFWI